jgi:hypothetical protein
MKIARRFLFVNTAAGLFIFATYYLDTSKKINYCCYYYSFSLKNKKYQKLCLNWFQGKRVCNQNFSNL